jgi:N-methylhydantoinase A
VFSAQGILGADMRLARQRSVLQQTRGGSDPIAGLDGAALEATFRQLEAELGEAFAGYAVGESTERQFRRSVSMRYSRQIHEIPVPVDGALDRPDAVAALVGRFNEIYAHRYGSGAGSRRAVVEITNCQLQLVGLLPKFERAVADPGGALAPSGRRQVYIRRWTEVPVYRWEALPLGGSFAGPALVDAPGTTVWVGAADRATIDPLGNLRLEATA